MFFFVKKSSSSFKSTLPKKLLAVEIVIDGFVEFVLFDLVWFLMMGEMLLMFVDLMPWM